jgi:hypothetical protein
MPRKKAEAKKTEVVEEVIVAKPYIVKHLDRDANDPRVKRTGRTDLPSLND